MTGLGHGVLASANSMRLLKQINIVAVLQVLRHKSPISRAEIARMTGLTPATVSSIVAILIEARVAREVGPGESNGGRPPILLEFNPQAFYLVGVDLGVSKVLAVVIDLDGNIVSKAIAQVNVHSKVREIVEKMFQVTRDAIAGAGHAAKKIAGIGLSVPGLVDVNRGISVFAPNIPAWREVPIAPLFYDEFEVSCLVENDARAMALGEARFGAGRGWANILCVNVGRGIGAGLILGGQIYRGEGGAAGEIGHMTVDPNGPMCPCGNSGCLEVLAAGPAIAAAAIRAVSTGTATLIRELVGGRIEYITAEIVSSAAAQGDSLASRLIQEAGRFLGIGIANAINLISPEIVVVGGGVSRAGELLFEEIRRTVKERAFSARVNLPKIVPSSLGEEASGIGAAALVLEEMLESGKVLDRARELTG